MTALQALINQLTEQSKQDFSDKTLDEKLKMLEQEFSVRLRNNDSSADNTPVEQLHSDEELVSKIKDVMARFGCTISFAPLEIVRQSIQLEKF